MARFLNVCDGFLGRHIRCRYVLPVQGRCVSPCGENAPPHLSYYAHYGDSDKVDYTEFSPPELGF